MSTVSKFSPEVRERAVRMVVDHGGEYDSEWAAIRSIASKVGCTAETLRRWVRQTQIDRGTRPGVRIAEAERVKQRERENRAQRSSAAAQRACQTRCRACA